jgi:hypothetical protein
MRQVARPLLVSLILTGLLGACQATPTGAGSPFQTQDQPVGAAGPDGGPDAAARRRSPQPPSSSRPAPRRPAPAKPRPKPSKPAPVGSRPAPRKDRPAPSRPTPYPTRYRDYPPEYNDGGEWQRRQAEARITRVWTDAVEADQLTIHWTTDRPTIGMVEWGATDFVERSEWQMTPDTYHSVVVSDLEPDTEYRFRVMARVTGGIGTWSPELRARTAP